MQTTKELVTLQFGEFGNHVASHFWNLEYENAAFAPVSSSSSSQEDSSLNHDSITNNLYKHSMRMQQPKHKDTPYNSSNYQPTPASRATEYSERKALEHRLGGLSNLNMQNSYTNHRNINAQVNFFYNPNQSRILANSGGGGGAGENIHASGYLPRTVIFAMNGEEGNVYESTIDFHNHSSDFSSKSNTDSNTIFTWDKEMTISYTKPYHEDMDIKSNENTNEGKQQRKKKNKNITQLKYWSDYLLPPLHEKSLFLLPGVHHYSSPFHFYSHGHDLVSSGLSTSSQIFEDMQDRIRYFVELCDCFQGFQIFCGGNYDGWSAIVPTVINNIVRDDYGPHKAILLYDCQPSLSAYISSQISSQSDLDNDQTAIQEVIRTRCRMNNILSMVQIWNGCNQIIPLSVDYWSKLASGNKIQDASVMASVIHQHNSICRTKSSQWSLTDITDAVTLYPSMKMAMLSAASSHIPMDLNYQLIETIQQLLALPTHDIKRKEQIAPPIFNDRLMCLSPIPASYFNDHSTEWTSGEILGEYSCINGSCIYENNDSNRREKLKLLLSNNTPMLDAEDIRTDDIHAHQKLFAKCLIGGDGYEKTIYPRTGHLTFEAWKLPTNYPFSNAWNKAHNTSNYEDELTQNQSDYYSLWSSLWTGKIIGDYYLNECSKEITQVIKGGKQVKLLGDNLDLDLVEIKEDLLGWKDGYQPLS